MLSLLLATLFVSPSFGTPKELLASLPDDYTFSLVVNDLRLDQGTKLSKLGEDKSTSQIVELLKSSEDWVRLTKIKDHLVRELGKSEDELAEVLFNGTIVLAYRKSAGKVPENESGALIIKPKNPKLLKDIIERVNQIQIKSGELKSVEEVAYKIPYLRRVKSSPDASSDFYNFDGQSLIFTSSETFLREVLERRHSKASVSNAALALTSLGLEKEPIFVLVNPRSFDVDVEAGLISSKPKDKPLAELFWKTWKAIDHLGVFISADPHPTLGLTVSAQPEKLPPLVRSIFGGFNRPLQIWNRIPESVLFGMALPINLNAVDDFFKMVLPKEDHAKMVDAVLAVVRPIGEELSWEQFLNSFGPEFAFWVSPPEPGSKNEDPSLAVVIPLNTIKEKQSLKIASDGLDFGVRFLSLTDRSYRVATSEKDGVKIRTLSHPRFPAGVEPSYAIKDESLIVASHPRMIKEYQLRPDKPKTSTESTLFRISGNAWQSYLKSGKNRILSVLAQDEKSRVEMDKAIDLVSQSFDVLDRVELNLSTESKRATLKLQLIERAKVPAK